MKLAVMQPYLFPYIGYFQLIHAADLFLVYDDVTYIKQGFINRNSVLTPNGATRFTVPVPGASSNKLISNLDFSPDVGKVLKTIKQSYANTPYFQDVFPLISRVLEQSDRSIASVCLRSYEEIFSYLGLDRRFERTSRLDYYRAESAQDRLINLCHKFDADCYINSSGGRDLYSRSRFSEEGIKLRFIESLPLRYSQKSSVFVPNLSIIDVIMNCSPGSVVSLLEKYELD